MGFFNKLSTGVKPDFSNLQHSKDIVKASISDKSFNTVKKAAGGGILFVALGAGFVTSANQYHSTSASLIAETIEEQQAAMAKSATPTVTQAITNGDGDPYTPAYNNLEMQEIFCEIVNDPESGIMEGYEEPKSWGLLACYNACIGSGLNSSQAIGLLACACREGTPVLLQHSGGEVHFPLGKYGESYRSTPIFIDTQDKVQEWYKTLQAVSNLENPKDSAKYKHIAGRGCGTAQWTDTYSTEYGWSLRGKKYMDVISPHVNDTPKDSTLLWIADKEMYSRDFAGGYADLITGMPDHDSTLEDIVVFSFGTYENGVWKDKYGHTISSYVTHWPIDKTRKDVKINLDNRYSSAKCIYKYFLKYELIEDFDPQVLN